MCVRGYINLVNTTNEFLRIHVNHEDGWGYFRSSPSSKREGPELKFTEEPWFPGRQFSTKVIVTLEDGKQIWSGDVDFQNFHILANSFVMISVDIAGNYTVDSAKFDEIQSKIAKWFFDHDGPSMYPLGTPPQFEFDSSEYLEAVHLVS